MKKNLATKIIVLMILGGGLITTGLSCKLVAPSDQALLQPINLSWWGTNEDPAVISNLVADYKLLHPNINITYKRLRPEEFQTQLINALAEDRGPDIISIKNTEVNQYLSKITPLPATTKMAYQSVKKTLGIKNELVTEIKNEPSITIGQLQNAFIDVVASDVVVNNKIYGLPISVDTLVLFYNRRLFNNANIPLPPNNWLDFQANVKKLTYQDSNGNLTQSGAAIGLTANVENYFDIVSLLMMQNGANMINQGRSAFHLLPAGSTQDYNPGPEAIRFFTDFSNSSKEVYTWNDQFANSIDAFASGKVAMMFGYQRDIQALEAKRQGNLDYQIAPIPQIAGRPAVNIANYFVQTVSTKSKHINEAWNFIQFISTQTEAKKYLDLTKKLTALRSLVGNQLSSDQIGSFAGQLLTSKSWYHGKNYEVAQSIFAEMINSVINNTANP
ncbi:MAG: extracellular solute-binding protein, partial [Candidatus Buchananbacteria bacterium]|nr:extracellular solute-binding protein [Candidatus Buchananbacteria bacterium]